jgi:hypothetical protein
MTRKAVSSSVPLSKMVHVILRGGSVSHDLPLTRNSPSWERHRITSVGGHDHVRSPAPDWRGIARYRSRELGLHVKVEPRFLMPGSDQGRGDVPGPAVRSRF